MNDEFRYWIAFSVFEGIGPARFKLLREYFGSAKEAFWADQSKLISVGISKNTVDRLVDFRVNFDIDKYMDSLERLKVRVLRSDDSTYPSLLKQTINPPIVLYVKSASDTNLQQLFSQPSLAVVGTRKITPYGKQVTQMIAGSLAVNGFCVVSGLALGVDGVAHNSVIENKGKTIAVMGCGLDTIYPRSHQRLAERIIESGGAWVSEYPLGSKALPGNFPARNRIISGVCLGVVVTEAANDSGSLITARCATEQGREVFAVPGPITSQVSAGTLSLLKQGATPIAGVDDILECLPGFKRSNIKLIKDVRSDNLSEVDISIIDILKSGSLSLDEIIKLIGCPAEVTASILSVLEIKGIVVNDGGSYFIKN